MAADGWIRFRVADALEWNAQGRDWVVYAKLPFGGPEK